MNVIVPRNPGLVLAVTFASAAASVAAETCTILSQCSGGANCEAEAITLAWSKDGHDTITLNGKMMPAQWVLEPTLVNEIDIEESSYQIVAPGPMISVSYDRISVLIGPAEQSDYVVATMMQIPRLYMEYEDALNNRTVFYGPCEGLF